MKTENYSKEINVKVSPEIAFQALTHEIDSWWGTVSNSVTQKNDVFTVYFDNDQTHWTFRIVDIKPNRSIDMECIEADHSYDGASEDIRDEWLGTTLRWKLTPTQDGTRISFIHEGLVNNLECYEICVSGWEHFFVGSLQRYLNQCIGIR